MDGISSKQKASRSQPPEYSYPIVGHALRNSRELVLRLEGAFTCRAALQGGTSRAKRAAEKRVAAGLLRHSHVAIMGVMAP